eukprot:1820054-Ditylum_brightwellii.AAC.1
MPATVQGIQSSCITPPAQDTSDFLLVRLTDTKQYWSNTRHYFYEKIVQIYSIVPFQVPLNNEAAIIVNGSFPDQIINLNCFFGDEISNMSMINSSSVQCTAPKREEEGNIDFFIGTSNERISNKLSLEYYSMGTIESIDPPISNRRGLSTIVLKGSGFTSTSPTNCKFGEHQVTASFVSETELHCVPPKVQRHLSTTTLAITSSGIQ